MAAGRLLVVSPAEGAPEPLDIWAVFPTVPLVPPKVRLFVQAVLGRWMTIVQISQSSVDGFRAMVRELSTVEGRWSIRDYWVKCLIPLWVSMIVVTMVTPLALWPEGGLLFFPVWIWSLVVISVKRCHDRGRSGWFLAIYFIPLVGGLWLFVELALLPGTKGANRFGPDPRTGQSIAARRITRA